MPRTHILKERRVWKRFPLRLGADCLFRKKKAPRAFPVKRTGEVQNLSVGGCCLAVTEPALVEVGMTAQLRIDWPAKLDEDVALRLHLWGHVLRVDGFYVAVAIRRYQFRLKGSVGVGGLRRSA